MTDLQQLFQVIDHLQPDELEQVRRYVEERRRTTWWIVPPENLEQIDAIMRPVQEEAALMSEEEINAAIDEALTEIRRERTHQSSD
jgi:hypothetical protein